MTLYFLGIGFGYILVQLGLHQRLIIIVGHPTFALSVVLFSMLLGTGIGAASTSKLFAKRGVRAAGAAILVVLVALLVCFPAFPAFGQIESQAVRLGAVGLMLGGVGFVLGFAFPLGVVMVAPTGEWAVQKNVGDQRRRFDRRLGPGGRHRHHPGQSVRDCRGVAVLRDCRRRRKRRRGEGARRDT